MLDKPPLNYTFTSCDRAPNFNSEKNNRWILAMLAKNIYTGSSTSCVCWLINRYWDTRQNTSQTFLHQLPNFWVNSHYVPCYVATLLRHGCQRIGDRAFSAFAPRVWNKLPTELKLLRSTGSFRRGLKTFLFDSVYGHQDTDWLCDAPSVF